MLTQERHNKILELLTKQDTVTVGELSQGLETSESTIRRDLVTLDTVSYTHLTLPTIRLV